MMLPRVAGSRRLILVGLVVPVVAVSLVSHSTATAPAERAPTSPSAVLGITYRPVGGALAWFAPRTLKVLRGRKAPLASHVGGWAFSADRSVAAIASCDEQLAESGLRFVNVRAMRVLGDLKLSDGSSCVGPLAWLRPNRLLAGVFRPGEAEVVVVDPAARRVVRRTALPGEFWEAVDRTREELVLMLGNRGAFEPARVAVVDAEGSVRVARIERVLVGSVVDEQSADPLSRQIVPGLAVDPDSRKAYLFPASGFAAELDLRTLSVSYHELDRPSLLSRISNWLVEAAYAKAIEGPYRQARWLGNGLIALSGTDYAISRSDGEERTIRTPVGVRLVDTRFWKTRMLSPGSNSFVVAPNLVIAQGGRWDEKTQRSISPGLVAFGLDGDRRWQLHPGEERWVDPEGSLGYVWLDDGKLEVVDLATGRPLRTILRNEQLNPWPRLLAAQQSDW